MSLRMALPSQESPGDLAMNQSKNRKKANWTFAISFYFSSQ